MTCHFFAYIRVSTVKQGEHGSSLNEQRDAIVAFAARNGIQIAAWFEERETAAKVGRHEFSRMLKALQKGAASGVIFHKIDRSARNLKDWSVIQELADQGIDVRFAHESVNLASNEGKLTGDFLAVIASHYIRNLRDEVKKGMRGRLKQGLYPLAAPLGYLDQGGGKAKTPDPIRAPLVRDAFELYAAGLPLHALSDELYRRGLRSKIGKQVGVNRLSEMLHNPFYMGIIRMKRSGAHYDGVHQPLISKSLFDRAQDVLRGKANKKAILHDFVFRRLIACASCNYHLIAERQKGHTYYRCHTKECPTCSIREEVVDEAVQIGFKPFDFTEEDVSELRQWNAKLEMEWADRKSQYESSLALQIENNAKRMSRLTDAYLDAAIDRSLFEQKKLELLLEAKALQEQLGDVSSRGQTVSRNIDEFLERVKSLPLTYENGNLTEKREILESTTSNLVASGKNVVVELQSPFREVAELDFNTTGAPVRGRPRNRPKKIFNLLVAHFTSQNR
ncbi:MAG: site-specific recombinase [Alphaproteobacteria bacterium]|jgi:DNA invertase Pin-like site-specific DNA recombinase|nr:site-specific recombinase [Alphaproteobacteria bacterium]